MSGQMRPISRFDLKSNVNVFSIISGQMDLDFMANVNVHLNISGQMRPFSKDWTKNFNINVFY
jgi:hypothetical protein